MCLRIPSEEPGPRPFGPGDFIEPDEVPTVALGGAHGSDSITEKKPYKVSSIWIWPRDMAWLVTIEGVDGAYKASRFHRTIARTITATAA